jgi:O-antigen/teichoic acid export membrane protein
MRLISSIKMGFVSKLLSLGSNLIILPMILTSLDRFEFTLWMLFISFYSLVAIFDFGFSATISRNFSYAKNLFDPNRIGRIKDRDGACRDSKISEIQSINTKLFTFLLTFAACALCFVYYYYIYLVDINLNGTQTLSWIIFSASILILFLSVKSNGYLHGMGHVDALYLNTIFSNIAFLFLAIVFLFLDFGLLGLCFARLVSSLCMLFFNSYSERQYIKKDGIKRALPKRNSIGFNSILSSSIKMGGAGVGNYMLNRTTILILASYFSISEIANVSFLINICITLLSGCLVIVNNMLPVFIAYRANRDTIKLKNSLIKTFLASSILFIFCYFSFVTLAPIMLMFFESSIEMPSFTVLIICFWIFYLELIQSISIAFISTKNELHFYKYQLSFGLVYVSLVAVIGLFDWTSIEMILLLQLVIQLVFNFWWWPYQCFREFKNA